MSLFDKASLVLTPNGVKEGKLYSVKPTDGSGDLDVVRATTATRVNSDGLIEVVPYNLLTYSEQFDNATWTKVNSTITANQATAPNGTLTADLYTATTASDRIQSAAPAISATYTFSIWVKNTGSNVDGIITFGGIGTETFTATSEWQRIIATATTNLAPSLRLQDAGESVYIWGAQLVEGTEAKDYYPTETRLNIPRLDYSNGSCPSILVEPQRTNLALRSEEFDNASWNKAELNISGTPAWVNVTEAPDGTMTSEKIIPNTTNASHFFFQNAATVLGTFYTISVFAKAGENTILQITGSTGFEIIFANFDLINGIVSNTNGGVANIQPMGGGWYRCSYTLQSNATGGSNRMVLAIVPSPTSTRLESFAGNNSNGLFIWGAQLEAGANATSYIPTVGSQITRNQDVISKTGISDVLLSNGYSILINIQVDSLSVYSQFQFRESPLNYILRVGSQIKVANATSINNTLGFNKIMVSVLSNGNYTLYKNGLIIQSGTGVTGNLSQINTDAVGYKIKNIQLYKTALTDQECINLTTI